MRGVLHDYNYITTCTHQGDDYFVGAKLQIIITQLQCTRENHS